MITKREIERALTSIDSFADALEGLKYSLDGSGEIDVSFPAVWGETDGHGGPPVADPTAIYVYDCGGEEVIGKTTLGAMVTEVMTLLVNPVTRTFDNEGTLRDIAESMRDEANRIEHALIHGYIRPDI